MIKYLFIALVLLFSNSDCFSQLSSTNNGTISFRSDAPLELITASSKEMKGRIDTKRRLFAFSVKMNSFKGFKGNLTIHGVTKERIIKSDVTVKNGKISILSAFTVLLSDHNIPVPKVVHEKLASEIKVEVKADLTQP